MSVAATTSTPTKQRDPYGVPITQTDTNQEVIQIPYVAGRVRIPVMWVGGPYNVRAVAIEQKQGSGKGATTATVGYKYYADLIGIICLGPIDGVRQIIINNSVVWSGNVRIPGDSSPAQFGLPSDDGQVRIYWGTAFDAAPSWFATGSDVHPGYRWRARIELHQLLYGASDTTQAPNVEVVIERYSTMACQQFDQVLGTGYHALYLPEIGVSPFACIYEWMFHPVYGAGMTDTTDLTNWKNAIADTSLNQLMINPKIDAAQTFKSLITTALQYFDCWFRRIAGGIIQVGRYAHIAATPVLTLNDHDFLAEPKITTKMLDDTLNQAIVKFTNQYNWWKADSAVYNDFGNQLMTGQVKFVNYDRPWIANPNVAFQYASMLATLYANPIISGTITVSKELIAGANCGDLIQIDSDTYNMAGLFRVTSKTFSDATKWTCDVGIEQERGTFPQIYSDTGPTYPGLPYIEALDISNAKIIELPAGLGKSTVGPVITILAQKPEALMQGFTPWFTQDPPGSQVYDDANVQCRFAVAATLSAPYGVTTQIDTVYGFVIHCTDLDVSRLVSQPNLSRDNFQWLIFGNREIMSMGAMVALGGNYYRIYPRRGCYGTQIAYHYTNEILWFVPRANLPMVTHAEWEIGQTWYFKLQGFNTTNTFDLADSSIFEYTFTGDSGSSNLNGPTNFIVGTSGNIVLFNWLNDTSPNAVGYEIRYGLTNGSWYNAKVAATDVPNCQNVQLSNIPPNVWVFYLASMDVYGDYSTPVTYTLTIPAFTYILVEENFGPAQHALDVGVVPELDWGVGAGTLLTACLVHPTAYCLLPQDTQAANYIPPGGTGFELFDNFVNGWPATCTATFPVLDSLGEGTSIRSSEIVNEFLIGLLNQGIIGEDFVIALHPDWHQATITNGVVHPTAYCVMPTTVHNASYVPTGGTGFEIFNQFIFDAKSSTTIQFVQDVNEPYPWDATLDAGYSPGYSNGAMAVTLSISWSSDLITWHPLVSGQHSLSTNYVARYVMFELVIDNTHPNGYVKTMNGEIIAGSSKYWTSIYAEIQTSNDNITFGDWYQISSVFVSDRYIKPRINWNPRAGVWPVSVASIWMLLDSASLTQSDFGVAVGSGGTTITFPIPYRQKVSVTVTSVSGSSAYAEVTSYTLTNFSVQVFNAGVPIAGTINWHSVGI
jgi:hypothetical protein